MGKRVEGRIEKGAQVRKSLFAFFMLSIFLDRKENFESGMLFLTVGLRGEGDRPVE